MAGAAIVLALLTGLATATRPTGLALVVPFALHVSANPLLSPQFANPLYFIGFGLLLYYGWCRRWINRYEGLASIALLLIPYVTIAHHNAMASFGRFSAVVLPAYLVMGHLLVRLRPAIAAALLAISAFFLGVYSALFAAGYRLI